MSAADQPVQPLDLDAIRARAADAKAAGDQTRFAGPADLVAHGLRAAMSAADVPDLIAEVELLRGEVARLHELRRAAAVWRAQFEKPVKLPRMAALIDAVDKLAEGSAR